jgi:hypothetical protein
MTPAMEAILTIAPPPADERAREAARDFAPLFEAADTVAHGRYCSLCLPSRDGRGGTQRHIWALRQPWNNVRNPCPRDAVEARAFAARVGSA